MQGNVQKKFLNLEQKTLYLGFLGYKFEKHRHRICLMTIFRAKTKMSKFEIKNALFRRILQKLFSYLKSTPSNLSNTTFLTHTINFGVGSAFSKSLFPLAPKVQILVRIRLMKYTLVYIQILTIPGNSKLAKKPRGI